MSRVNPVGVNPEGMRKSKSAELGKMVNYSKWELKEILNCENEDAIREALKKTVHDLRLLLVERRYDESIEDVIRLSALIGAFDEQLRIMEQVATKVVKNYDDLRDAIERADFCDHPPKRKGCCTLL